MDERDINTDIVGLMIEKLRVHGKDYKIGEYLEDIRKLGMIALEEYVNEIMED